MAGGGSGAAPAGRGVALGAAIGGAVAVGAPPRLFARYRHQVITLDRAVPDEQEARSQLEALLGARVHTLIIRSLDLVRDTTVIDVRYELARNPAASGDQAVEATGVAT